MSEESDVREFPARCSTLPVAHHVFEAPVSVPSSLELDRHPQTERTCKLCGAVKVTVHGPDGSAWREWRSSSSSAQWRLTDDLPCRPAGGAGS